MAETKDLVYEQWIKDAFEDGSAKQQRTLMIQLLARIVELLESQGRVRPS